MRVRVRVRVRVTDRVRVRVTDRVRVRVGVRVGVRVRVSALVDDRAPLLARVVPARVGGVGAEDEEQAERGARDREEGHGQAEHGQVGEDRVVLHHA